MLSDDVILCEIFRSPRMTCRLGWYPPFHWQAHHVHSDAQVSFLLSGEFRERACGREFSATLYCMGAKPQGAKHSVAFGPNGALILSFDLHASHSDDRCRPVIPGGTWRWTTSSLSRHLVADLSRRLSGPIVPSAAGIEDTFWDAVAAQDAEAAPKLKQLAPLWLSRLKQSLDDEPACVSVSAAARTAGVHRTHLARMFRQCFGVSSSAYPRRVLAGVAVNHLAGGETLVTASCAAGFADQSHMTRVVKAEIGFTPGVLRRLLLETGGGT